MPVQKSLQMWDDIQTWVSSQNLFIFPDLNVDIPSKSDYLTWRQSLQTANHTLKDTYAC